MMGSEKSKTKIGANRRMPDIFDSQFDYPKYLEFLKSTIDRKHLTDIEFDDGELFVPYKHNIPAKDFFKVRVSFFKVGNPLKG